MPWIFDRSRASKHADLVGENLVPASYRPPRRSDRRHHRIPAQRSAPCAFTASPMACNIFRSSGLGLYLGKVKSRSAVHAASTSAPMRRQQLRVQKRPRCRCRKPRSPSDLGRESLCRLVTACRYSRARMSGDRDIEGAAGDVHAPKPSKHNFLDRVAHLVGAKRDAARSAPIFTPGPAILVMARRSPSPRPGASSANCAIIGDRRQSQSDVMHLGSRHAISPDRQGLLDGKRNRSR